MTNNTSLQNIISTLDEQLDNALISEIDNIDMKCKLWNGAVDCKLVSIDTTANGNYTMTFTDTEGNPMPSQFDGQIGNIYIGTQEQLVSFLKSIKVALHMPSTLKPSEVVAELEKPHRIAFIVRTSMKSWGLSMYNRIDMAATMAL